MAVEFVGGLFPRNQLAPRGAYGQKPDLNYLRDLARAHEHAGFDRVLIANGGPDPAVLAAYAASQTERLGFMIAHRPGLVAPTVAARAFATLDHVTGGRIRLHAITGHAVSPCVLWRKRAEKRFSFASRFGRKRPLTWPLRLRSSKTPPQFQRRSRASAASPLPPR